VNTPLSFIEGVVSRIMVKCQFNYEIHHYQTYSDPRRSSSKLIVLYSNGFYVMRRIEGFSRKRDY